MYKLMLSILISSLLFSCDNPKRAILGKWMMHQVIQGGKDVTEEHNPKKDRFIIMDEDETFVSDGQPYGENTGKYDFNPMEKTLFIDSSEGENDDSNWVVSFDIGEKTMTWQGVGTEWAEDFKIIYVRPKRNF